MAKPACQKFCHLLPILALHCVSTHATAAYAFIAILFVEILDMISSFYVA
jgi:hypothetical protein